MATNENNDLAVCTLDTLISVQAVHAMLGKVHSILRDSSILRSDLSLITNTALDLRMHAGLSLGLPVSMYFTRIDKHNDTELLEALK